MGELKYSTPGHPSECDVCQFIVFCIAALGIVVFKIILDVDIILPHGLFLVQVCFLRTFFSRLDSRKIV